MVKTWTPCTNEVAMVMFEYVMDDFEEIWQEQEDKIIQQIKDDGAWMDDEDGARVDDDVPKDDFVE